MNLVGSHNVKCANGTVASKMSFEDLCNDLGGDLQDGICQLQDGEELETELSEEEVQGLHELQLAIEGVYQGYGKLLDAHHTIGGAMDHWKDGTEMLREAGHDDIADKLDDVRGVGVSGDSWTYELVQDARDEFVSPIDETHQEVREELADGVDHINERRQRNQWQQ